MAGLSYHRGLPAVWAQQNLEANADWLKIFGRRLYNGRSERKNEYPFAYIERREHNVDFSVGAQSELNKVVSEVSIIGVWHTANGQEVDDFDLQPSIDVMVYTLCHRIQYQEVVLETVKLGEVWQSEYRREVDFDSRNGDDVVRHRGIVLHLTHI